MNIKITVPSNLSEITLEQYQRYLKVIEDVEQNDKAQMFVDLKMMEIFCGVPYTTAMKFPMSEVSRINRIIGSVLNDKSELVRTFQMGDSTFGFIPKLDEMTFGEYIDLDNFFGDWNNMHKAMSVLYRPIDKTYKDTLYSIKEYDGDTFHNAMKQMPLDAVFSSIVFFLHFRERIVENYAELFTGSGGDGHDLKTGFNKKWGWYSSVQHLVKGNVERIEHITKLNFHTCLLALCYDKEKQEVENTEIRNKMNKNKSRR